MLDKLNRLSESHGHLPRGVGVVSGVIALGLGILSFLGVLAFHFPAYLTTPELRQVYNVDVLRQVLFFSLMTGGGIALWNIVLDRARWLSGSAFFLIILAAMMGGHRVPVGDFADHTPYVGLDWLVLDLLKSTLVFVLIEKLFPHRPQAVFRAEWQTDLTHFMVNHLGVGLVLLVTNHALQGMFSWAVQDGVQAWVRGLPFWRAG